MRRQAMEAETEAGSWERLDAKLAVFIARAKQGDVEAFDQFYLATAGWLLARVRRIVSDGQAEDVLAEVYIQAWRSLSSFDETRGSAATWLAMIARSRALDHLRHERSRPANVECDATAQADTADGPEQLLSRSQQARLVHVSMSLLDCQERLVLGLAYFRDCTQNEISSSTGLPLGTVKSLLSRAEKKLRNSLSRMAPARQVNS